MDPKNWCYYCEGYHLPDRPHQRVDPDRPKLLPIKEGLVIRPGDTVVLTVHDGDSLDSPEKVEDYVRRLREAFPADVKLILTDGAQMTVSVIRRDASPSWPPSVRDASVPLEEEL